MTSDLRLPDPPAPVGLQLHHADGTTETPEVTYVGAVETTTGVVHAWRVNATLTNDIRISAEVLPARTRLMFWSPLCGRRVTS